MEDPSPSTKNDSFVGKSCSFKTPLHMAAFLGDLGSTKDLLTSNPEFAKVLDSYGRTALHYAAAEGHKEIVEELLKENKDACLKVDEGGIIPLHLAAAAEGHKEIVVEELLKENKDACLKADEGGRIPLHLAAMRGRVEVMKELINEKPESILKKMHGYTVLHLCVRYNHLDALKLLLKSKYIDEEFINSNDPNNETILLTSARLKQFETERYLVSHPRISVDSKSLAKAFGFGNSLNNDQYEKLRFGNSLNSDQYENLRGNLMVVASLIAQMSFQVATNPPGGFWQVDTKSFDEGCPEGSGICRAGTSILAYTNKSNYQMFTACSSLSFVASLSVILLLISQVPLQNKIFVGILIIGMWTSIVLIGATYIFSMLMVHVQTDNGVFSHLFSFAPILLAVLIISLVHHYIFQFGIKMINHKKDVIAKSRELSDSLWKKIKNLKSKVCCQLPCTEAYRNRSLRGRLDLPV